MQSFDPELKYHLLGCCFNCCSSLLTNQIIYTKNYNIKRQLSGNGCFVRGHRPNAQGALDDSDEENDSGSDIEDEEMVGQKDQAKQDMDESSDDDDDDSNDGDDHDYKANRRGVDQLPVS